MPMLSWSITTIIIITIIYQCDDDGGIGAASENSHAGATESSAARSFIRLCAVTISVTVALAKSHISLEQTAAKAVAVAGYVILRVTTMTPSTTTHTVPDAEHQPLCYVHMGRSSEAPRYRRSSTKEARWQRQHIIDNDDDDGARTRHLILKTVLVEWGSEREPCQGNV